MPSRKRVRRLATALTSMHYLQSRGDANRVHYYIIADNDDPDTIAFCDLARSEGVSVGMRKGPRFETMGGAINEVADFSKSDVYLVINDDTLCMSLNWDVTIAEAVEKTPHGVFWWKNALPVETLYPIVTDKWKNAAGSVFTDHYPFWFDDLCLIELWMMATGEEAIFLDCKLIDKPVHTHRMRDLRFWQQVYNKTRDLRLQKAMEIRKALKLPTPKLPADDFAKKITETFCGMTSERLHEIELGQGDLTITPDPAYLAAKTRMDSFMIQNVGPGWCSP